MASNSSLDVVLTPLGGEGRPLKEWLTTFNLACVVLDPYTNESSWILKTAARILAEFRGADVRVNFVVACDEAGAKSFLGPLANEFLVFCDPDRHFIRQLGLDTLPAFVLVQTNGEVAAKAEGWDGREWRSVAQAITGITKWTLPGIPAASDPAPFAGTAALA